MQEKLPNALPVLILGILSIVFSVWFVSFIGMTLSIVALVMSGKDMAHYRSDPSRYAQSSFGNLKAGRICAVIGLALSILFAAFTLLIILGTISTLPFWGMID